MTDLDDRMQTENCARILRVGGQGHFAVRVDTQIVACGHVTKANLLFPLDDVTLARQLLVKFTVINIPTICSEIRYTHFS